jgi:hypothetical protein
VSDETHFREDWRALRVPPSGGLQRLIGAVERPPRRVPVARLAIAGVFAAAIAAWGVVERLQAQAFERRASTMFARALAPAPAIRVGDDAAVELAIHDADLRVYWIAQMPATTRDDADDVPK